MNARDLVNQTLRTAVQGVHENPDRVWTGVTGRVEGTDDARAFGKLPCEWARLGRA